MAWTTRKKTHQPKPSSPPPAVRPSSRGEAWCLPACLPSQGKAPSHEHRGPLAEFKVRSNSIPGCSRARFRSWAAQRRQVWIKLPPPAGDTLFGEGGRTEAPQTSFQQHRLLQIILTLSHHYSPVRSSAVPHCCSERSLKAAAVIDTDCKPKLCRCILTTNPCAIHQDFCFRDGKADTERLNHLLKQMAELGFELVVPAATSM